MDIVIKAFYEPAAAPAFVPLFRPAEVASAFGVTSASALGAGAFGETWRLETTGQPDRAAKLILKPDYPPDRLAREIEGLQRASSPYVVDLLEAIQVTVGGAVRSALVFEFIDGGDVADKLTPGVPVPVDDVRAFARGLIAGVAELHVQQTVHRDIKPENIALRGGDWSHPVLLDLGLAKVLDQQSLTAYPTLMGTVPFMAPEQLRGDRARQMADMFAVGVVVYILLTGRHPFYGPESLALDHLAAITRLENGPDPLPGATPADLAELVNRLLSAEAYKRGSAARAKTDLDG